MIRTINDPLVPWNNCVFNVCKMYVASHSNSVVEKWGIRKTSGAVHIQVAFRDVNRRERDSQLDYFRIGRTVLFRIFIDRG
mmetsp:Transcript_1140/g.1592  ORF Transcript_1140/g.1592 Transcript_1140/m.1592 type:complete len:81 (+) Transcript_1140:91-333(+)